LSCYETFLKFGAATTRHIFHPDAIPGALPYQTHCNDFLPIKSDERISRTSVKAKAKTGKQKRQSQTLPFAIKALIRALAGALESCA
jgi:hypothetical protein